MIILDLVRQCPVCWRFLGLWSSNWVSSKSHQFHAINGADPKCKRLLWFESLQMQLPKVFWCKIQNSFTKFKICRSLESVHILRSSILFLISTGKAQGPLQHWGSAGGAGAVQGGWGPIASVTCCPPGTCHQQAPQAQHTCRNKAHLLVPAFCIFAHCQVFFSGLWGHHITKKCCFLALIHPPSKLGVL